MNTIWGHTTNRILLVALLAAGALLWPAAATAAPTPGTYTWNGHTFNTEDARIQYSTSLGTYFMFDYGLNANWDAYSKKFLSGDSHEPWWAYRGRTTRMDIGDGCAYVQHRRGEFEINPGYRVTCNYGARVADYVIDNRRAPANHRCLKRGDVFYCSRFTYGRQTAKFTYRTEIERKIRLVEQYGIVMECGAAATGGTGQHGWPHKYVVFARDVDSCDRAFSDHTALENMIAYSGRYARPADPYSTIGGDMHCFRIGGGEYMACTNGARCVVLTPFSDGSFPVVRDGRRAWSAFAMASYDLFSNC